MYSFKDKNIDQIKDFSLSYQQKKVSDQKIMVYLRWYKRDKTTKQKEYLDQCTGYTVTPQQYSDLKAGIYTTDKTLQQIKTFTNDFENRLFALMYKLGQSLNKDLIKKHLLTAQTSRTLLNDYWDEYQNRPQLKPLSRKNLKSISNIILPFLKSLTNNSNNLDLFLSKLINKETLSLFEGYLIRTNKYSHHSIINYLDNCKSFINYIANKHNIATITHKNNLRPQISKVHLTTEQFNIIVNYPTKKPTEQKLQMILYINSFIGLRFSDLIKIDKSNIEQTKENLIKINYLESKTNNLRSVYLADKQAINYLKELSKKTNRPFLLSKYHAYFNTVFKNLAKKAIPNDKTLLVKTKGNQTYTVTVPTYTTVGSHTIRRFAVMSNLVKYGIKFAASQSGHKDFKTLQKHYTTELTDQQAFQILTGQ